MKRLIILVIIFLVVFIMCVDNYSNISTAFIFGKIFIISIILFILILIRGLYYRIKLKKVLEKNKFYNNKYSSKGRLIDFYAQYIYNYKKELLLIKYLMVLIILIILISAYFYF